MAYTPVPTLVAGDTITDSWTLAVEAAIEELQANLPDDAVSFNPVLSASTSNPDLGTTGTSVGFYTRNGREITMYFVITFGGTGISQGSGTYEISVPEVPIPMSGSAAICRGFITVNDASVGFRDWKAVASNSGIRIRALNTSYGAQTDATSANIGVTFAAGDQVTGQVTYLAA